MGTQILAVTGVRMFRYALGSLLLLAGTALLVAKGLVWLDLEPKLLRALQGGALCALGTALGAVPVLVIRKMPVAVSDTLLGFGAGVMLAATAFSLIVPGIAAAQHLGLSSWGSSGLVSAGILLGAFCLFLVDRKVSGLGPQMFTQHPDEPVIAPRIWLFVIAIVAHNIPEGMAVGVSAGGGMPDANSLAMGIALQDVPEGLVIALVLAGAGMSRVKALAAIDDHVADEGRQRDEAHVAEPDLLGEGGVVGDDTVVGGLAVIDQVHLVHGHDDVGNADQLGQVAVAAGLGEDAFACVDQDDGDVGGGGGGHHVAGVLLVAGRVGNDVLAGAGGEVTVGDVDGDALFALGLQAVGEQRQVDGGEAALGGRALDGGERVGQDGLGVEEQAADQGALAVIDRAAGQETQQAAVFDLEGGGVGAGHDFRNTLPSCAAPWRRRKSGRRGGLRRVR